ncbi:beta strand repeat-containing protein [Cohnella fermenti]|uniref:SLH domain-containing protein n=1 Tax=Cohnella fermenti TaxID=2565925 RepID=A0A4S4BZX9_9BACL|nr:Ig-like domain-containing protein [Cohnella fermenti]THF80845.1 hypothetical protein E6C55_10220 [Cohnella fermenti]
MHRIRTLAIILVATLLVQLGLTSLPGDSSTVLASGTNGPLAIQLMPKSGGTLVPSGTNLKITFDENVVRGTGNITIQRLTGGSYATVDVLNVQSNLGNVLLEQPTKVATIIPSSTLTAGSYKVVIDGTAFASLSTGRFYQQASDWTFTVVDSSTLAPAYSPTSGTTNFSADTAQTITLTYPSTKTMKKGSSGNIYVKRVSDNATIQTISATSSSVTASGQVVSIKLSKLDYGTAYYILIDMGAILDSDNNEYGITSAGTWSFTTKAANDVTAPTVVSFSPTSGGTLGQLAGSLSVEFSENVYSGSGTFTIKQGTTTFCTIPASSSGITGYGTTTITINPTSALCAVFADNTTYTVTISNLAVHDAAGNNYAGTSSWSFKVSEDADAPEIVTLSPVAGVSNVSANVGTFSMKFNKSVTVASGATARIKALSGTYSGTVVATASMSRSLTDSTVVNLTGIPVLSAATKYAVYIDSGLITDVANGNVFPGILNDYRWSFQTVGSDLTAPMISSAAMDGMSVLLTYNEVLDESSVPAAANYYVTVNDVAAQVTAVTVSGKQVWVKLQNSVAVGQKVTISYTAGTNPIVDLSGNKAANLSSLTVSNTTSTTVPKPSSGSISGSVLTLNFNKSLNDLPSNVLSQFTVKFDSATVGIRTITLYGTTLTMTLSSSPTSSQSVSVSYTPSSSTPIQDLSGNTMAAFSSFYITNGIDVTAPVLSSGTAASNIVTLYFNEGLNTSAVPAKSSFSVLANGSSAAISSVAIDNNAVILTLSASVAAGTVIVTYIPGTTPLTDLAGNAASLISNYSIAVGTSNSAAVYSSGSVSGSTVTLNFSSSLNASYIAYPSQFTVAVGTGIAAVTSVQVSGAAVTLTLSSSIASGQAVTVTYSTAGNALRDSLGLTVAAFGPVTLSNGTTSLGSLTSYLDYNSEGGLTFNSAGATTTTDTLSTGTAATRYNLNADYLTSAFSMLQLGSNITKLQLSFIVPSSETGALVAIPIKSLVSGTARNPNAVLRIEYGDYEFDYPLLAISSSTLSSYTAKDASAYLLLQIARTSNATLLSAITTQGGTLLGSMVDFTAYTVTNGVKTEVAAYDNYVTRSITLSNASSLTDSQLSVVRYDYDSNDLSYTPTTITRDGTSVKLSFERKGNSAYAAVSFSKTFSDVTAAWAKDSVNILASKFVIDRTSAVVFQPNQNITRADFAKYIARGLGLTSKKSAATRFSDVGTNGTYSGYIGAASEAGIVQGGTDGRFLPNAYITREEMATMMQRAIAYVGQSVSTKGTELNAFTDSGKISSYAKTAVLQNVAAGIMNGVSSYQFKPQSNATRAEAAVMIERMLKYVGFLQA